MLIDYRLLGDRIRQQRRNKGRTQENFAEYLNVSVGYISQIERGITRVSLERLVDISHYLDCSISLLLDGTDITERNYLESEFNELFQQLSNSEKKTVTLLLKEYIRSKNSTAP
ncbi:helix-turn-helix domain-containing protein [Lachnoclostridium sp. An76]|uniref:helix-turn-helix domain-containing protein n=1 Tax=Lachnoclostridium sp. An76 TaxID=1965654 RepID=UPI000B36B539|nr:hypothetical protein B5G27_00995 [Lachnoclostridium sp. An76]